VGGIITTIWRLLRSVRCRIVIRSIFRMMGRRSLCLRWGRDGILRRSRLLICSRWLVDPLLYRITKLAVISITNWSKTPWSQQSTTQRKDPSPPPQAKTSTWTSWHASPRPTRNPSDVPICDYRKGVAVCYLRLRCLWNQIVCRSTFRSRNRCNLLGLSPLRKSN
jgi:hypothetical protein